MTTRTCESCPLPIPAGTAVVRSALRGGVLTQLAWHRECWAWRIPEQRRAEERIAR